MKLKTINGHYGNIATLQMMPVDFFGLNCGHNTPIYLIANGERIITLPKKKFISNKYVNGGRGKNPHATKPFSSTIKNLCGTPTNFLGEVSFLTLTTRSCPLSNLFSPGSTLSLPAPTIYMQSLPHLGMTWRYSAYRPPGIGCHIF